AKVTGVSGRGVGMDVVKNTIEQLGGRVDIQSTQGKGTIIRLRLPLTLAIISALIVTVENSQFAIPQTNLAEVVYLKANEVANRIGVVGEMPVLRLRGKLVPLIRLSEILGIMTTYIDPITNERYEDRRVSIIDRRQKQSSSSQTEDRRRRQRADRRKSIQSDVNAVILKIGNDRLGLIVDVVRDIEEIVVKPLSTHLKDCRYFAGATIMGNGKIALILDVGGLADLAHLEFSKIEAKEKELRETEKKAQEKIVLTSILIFTNAKDEYFCIPLNSVSRVERIPISNIENVGERKFINYRDEGLGILHLEKSLPVGKFPHNLTEAYVIIPVSNQRIGILASSVVDTMQTHLRIQKADAGYPGLIGSTVIQNRLTIVLDINELLNKAVESKQILL
ncbi:MAG: chemotaxis protein CheW, partial [Planctomycetota bacterium]